MSFFRESTNRPSLVGLDPSSGAARLVHDRNRLLSRPDYFPGVRFGDPSWLMLTELELAHFERRQVSASSLVLVTCSPPTTALRHCRSLEAQGWIARRPDRNDGRRSLISATARTLEALDAWRRRA